MKVNGEETHKCASCDLRVPLSALRQGGVPEEEWDGWECPFCVKIDAEETISRVEQACARDVEWFLPTRNKPCAIVGGGPSLNETWKQAAHFQSRGIPLVALNGTLNFLLEKGITPEYFMMMDAREENLKFLDNAPEETTYLIASTVHPKAFDILENRHVIMWHPMIPKLFEPLVPILKKANPRAGTDIFIGGGSTIALRAIFVMMLWNFREIHLFGVDSCGTRDKHHAYTQSHNDEDRFTTLNINGRDYDLAPWMQRQAYELGVQLWDGMVGAGVHLFAYGDGLIQDIIMDRNAEMGRPYRKDDV